MRTTGRTLLCGTVWVVALACAACRAPTSDAPPGPSLSEVREKLAAREARLGGFDVAGRIVEGAHRAEFDFAFRPPLRLQGRMRAPSPQTLSFDGSRFFQRDDATGAMQVSELEGRPADVVSETLHGVFGAFVAEGFRAPLLPSSTTARWLAHPRAPEAVALSVEPQGGGGLRVIYVLRWPSMDFLEKRFEQGGTITGEVRMDTEQCEADRGLCVPTGWTHLSNGARAAQVTLREVRFGAELRPVEFTLPLPAVQEPMVPGIEAAATP